MRYAEVTEGVFLKRPNRFIAHVMINGREEICHVKNTGRCRELLIPGARVYLEKARGLKRKTAYDLIAVEKGKRLINMDSQAPNQVAAEWIRAGGLFDPPPSLRPEFSWGSSRFDFLLSSPGISPSGEMLLEVKGVTLEEDGAAFFPDAPTQRGVKHLRELIRAAGEGIRSGVLFVVQMEQVRFFSPHWENHPDFARALVQARKSGVEIWAVSCRVGPDFIKIDHPVPVHLE